MPPKLVAAVVIVVMLASIGAPVYASSDEVSIDYVLDEMMQGKRKTMTIEEFGVAVAEFLIRLVRMLQKIAVPIAIAGILVGSIISVVGMILVNPMLRRSGTGAIFGSITFLVLVRFAPIIVATIEGMTK